MSIFPTTPPGAKQTNCWNLIFILGIIGHIFIFISIIGIYDYESVIRINYQNNFGNANDPLTYGHLHNQFRASKHHSFKFGHNHPVSPSSKSEIVHVMDKVNGINYEIAAIKSKVYNTIFDQLLFFVNEHSLYFRIFEQLIFFIIFIIYMYHVHHMKLEVNNDSIEISMGPWSWYRNIWFMPGWIASSQIKKTDIISIHRKQRDCCFDIIFRCYCLPVNWCCCHKSYNSYWWPCCCTPENCGSCQCCNLCDGDSNTNDMLQINLTQSPFKFHTMWFKRCAPCGSCAIYTCCVYNRIAFSVKDETWVESLRMNGYPLTVGDSNNTQLNFLENKVVQV